MGDNDFSGILTLVDGALITINPIVYMLKHLVSTAAEHNELFLTWHPATNSAILIGIIGQRRIIPATDTHCCTLAAERETANKFP